MPSGPLRHRIHIQRAVQQRNPHGGVVEDWQTIATRWAAIEPLRARELFAAQQVAAQVTHRIRMRYYAGLKPNDRLLFNNRIFNIHGILNPGELNRELEVLCTETA